MAAAACASEEKGKEAEIVPVAPDPEPQQERDVILHQEHRIAQLEALEIWLQSLSARISKVLGPPGSHRAVTGDGRRRCLAFLDMEIGLLAAFVTIFKSNLQHFDGNRSRWVAEIVQRFLLSANTVVRRDIYRSGHWLLRRSAQCFDSRNLEEHYYETKNFYIMTEAPYWYPHLILTRSDLGHTPQLAEAGAIPHVGIDRPAKKILKWLRHQGNMGMSLRVMSIVGPVGIGKTTLAMELRNQIRQHEASGGRCYFQCNVMAQVPRGNDRNICLLQDILSQVSEPAATALSQPKTMEVLVRHISECLQDKRYFIIIDDIRQESDWEEIEGAFPITNNGSRILITTQVTSIAEACCSGSYYSLVHKMKPLNQIESERLLLAKAVDSAEGCLPNNLKLISGEILRRCNGIPLFLTAMADWLKEQRLQQQQQHQHQHEHKKFAIYCEQHDLRLPERLEQALSSAFNDLPHGDLRSLSLYMSMFPYGYKFDKDRLISKWVQEGHLFWSLDCLDLRRDRPIAEKFFSMLVDWNVITCVASKCKHMEDEAEACLWQVNHFMQQFLVSKSAEMGFVFTTATLNLLQSASPTTGHGNEPSSRIPQRLALHHPDPQIKSLLGTMDLAQTRSLAVSGAVSGIPLHRFVNLVVLDFEAWENLKDEDLVKVCKSKMFFLTYLNIRNTRVSRLPNEIKELKILETLDISYTQITELPLEVFQLNFLRHLDLRGTRISQLPKQIVRLRYILEILLVGVEGSINSLETATRLPHEICHDLTQDLAIYLSRPNSLKLLAVTWSSHLSIDRNFCEAFLSLIGRSSLESLTIHCGLGSSMEFLGSLEIFSAPGRLKKFKVAGGRFASVPTWIGGLWYLSFVQITVCKQVTDDLKILRDLPQLQCLILGLDFIPRQAIMIGDEGFRKLRRFSVDCPIPYLKFKEGAMPKLTYLQLKFCPTPVSKTVSVPSGTSDLPRLTYVALCYNAQYINSPSIRMTVDAVTKEVAKHHNPICLFVNGIEQDDVQEVDEDIQYSTVGTPTSTDATARDGVQAVDGVTDTVTAEIQCEITEAES